MSTTDQVGSGSGIDAETWATAQSSPEFTALRRKLRNFVFPVSALFLAWYLVYVLLADYAHGFMSIKLVGNINVGLVLGLLQFVSTFAITTWYVRYANRNLDPVAEEIRESLEGGATPAASEKGDADKGDAPVEDTKKSDAPTEDAGKGDAPSEDAEKGDAPAEDAEKGDAPAEDAEKGDAPAEDAKKGDAPDEDAEKGDASTEDAEKAEPAADDTEGGREK
ncbi:Uncharacterized membrane protein, DUF485 family [Saccharopolyspora antimicrobica]|uniref:Uncharacterized membrane protein (DUF485 family) n=1 Tax=Saccharopolyspora antimicrobica TaxID=455193 RepID=A0A1I4X521_9PSEU|nr:uncharacterized membrane protein (DUF485 family) [Saccharopolyspora antimicrobica]SFN20460.1 Uncharacterized membrane protein, DUF485 family [Saccharopolyspora antimicrobica]